MTAVYEEGHPGLKKRLPGSPRELPASPLWGGHRHPPPLPVGTVSWVSPPRRSLVWSCGMPPRPLSLPTPYIAVGWDPYGAVSSSWEGPSGAECRPLSRTVVPGPSAEGGLQRCLLFAEGRKARPRVDAPVEAVAVWPHRGPTRCHQEI